MIIKGVGIVGEFIENNHKEQVFYLMLETEHYG